MANLFDIPRLDLSDKHRAEAWDKMLLDATSQPLPPAILALPL